MNNVLSKLLNKTTPLFCSLCLAGGMATVSAQAADVTFGVLANNGTAAAIKKYKPLTDYLSSATGFNVAIKPTSFADLEKSVSTKQVDFFFANPMASVAIQEKFGGEFIASLINARAGHALNQFGGVIVVKADSPIQSIADLKGAKMGCVKLKAFGGYKMQEFLMLQHGVNPRTDTASMKELGTHDKVVDLVSKGLIDAGMVRTDTLERLASSGKLNLDSVRVLGEQPGDFPLMCSTRLYPEWSVVATDGVDSEASEKIKQALLLITEDSAPANAGKFVGFSEPLDYSPVTELIEALEVAAGTP